MRLSIILMLMLFSAAVYALPVELDDFSVTESAGAVELDWTTRFELDNDFFQIERSSDGINFLPIAAVTGGGTIYSTSTYSYTDNTVVPGTTYWYSVKQIDLDGSVNYFETKMVFVTALDGGEDEDFSFYPTNPTRFGTVYLQGNAATRQVALFGINGRQVFQQTVSSNSISLSAYNLSPGMYILQVDGTRKRMLVSP